MADFCSLRSFIFANKSRQIFSIVGFCCCLLLLLLLFFFFPEFISCLFIAAAIFVFLCGFSWLLQNPEIDQLEENPSERGAKCEDPDESLMEFLVVDHSKAEVVSSSINGGNQALQTQCRSHFPEIDKSEEYPFEIGEKYEDPGEFFCEFGEDKRSEDHIVSDRRKTEQASSSINGGNQTQYQSHPPTGALGSVRKEREWSRTLAGKLQDAGGEAGGAGEEMDLLWEAYEKTEENRGCRSGEKKKPSKKNKKNRIVDYLEDFDEEEGQNPQICCLQALKLSAGKMNFGMSKTGLMKISKSIRGIETGWLSRKKKRF